MTVDSGQLAALREDPVLEEYERDVEQREHPLLPGGSCAPGIVRGGIKENSVPDHCEIVVDRRLLPGESPDGEFEALRRRLAPIKDSDPDFEFEVSGYPAVFAAAEIDPDSRFAKVVLEAAEAVTGEPAQPCRHAAAAVP